MTALSRFRDLTLTLRRRLARGHLETVALALVFATFGVSAVGADASSTYVADLDRKHGRRIVYAGDANAEQILKGLVLDCRSEDGRQLPLRNLLLARLAREDPQIELRTEVQARGGDVRIVDVGRIPDGRSLRTPLMDVNKFGDIKMHGVRFQAVLNACFGSYGPIWIGGR